MATRGARYLHVLVPCPLGWGTAASETIQLARLAVQTGLFPLFEAERGEVVAATPLPGPRLPVEAYLRRQRRYAHLFKPAEDIAAIAAIQGLADRTIARYHLGE
jgi:pyruvate ferredoxin oxidoreductase beta subunit